MLKESPKESRRLIRIWIIQCNASCLESTAPSLIYAPLFGFFDLIELFVMGDGTHSSARQHPEPSQIWSGTLRYVLTLRNDRWGTVGRWESVQDAAEFWRVESLRFELNPPNPSRLTAGNAVNIQRNAFIPRNLGESILILRVPRISGILGKTNQLASLLAIRARVPEIDCRSSLPQMWICNWELESANQVQFRVHFSSVDLWISRAAVTDAWGTPAPENIWCNCCLWYWIYVCIFIRR